MPRLRRWLRSPWLLVFAIMLCIAAPIEMVYSSAFPWVSFVGVPTFLVLLRTAWLVRRREWRTTPTQDNIAIYSLEVCFLLIAICVTVLAAFFLGMAFGIEVTPVLYNDIFAEMEVGIVYGVIFAGMTIAVWAPSFLSNHKGAAQQTPKRLRTQPVESPGLRFGLGTVFLGFTLLCVNLALLKTSVTVWLGVNAVLFLSMFPMLKANDKQRQASQGESSVDRLGNYWNALWPRLVILYTAGLATVVSYNFLLVGPGFNQKLADGISRRTWTSCWIGLCMASLWVWWLHMRDNRRRRDVDQPNISVASDMEAPASADS